MASASGSGVWGRGGRGATSWVCSETLCLWASARQVGGPRGDGGLGLAEPTHQEASWRIRRPDPCLCPARALCARRIAAGRAPTQHTRTEPPGARLLCPNRRYSSWLTVSIQLKLAESIKDLMSGCILNLTWSGQK